jgi:hypothetical protein
MPDAKSTTLWAEQECRPWHDALESYPRVIEAHASDKLANLDRWFSEDLPAAIKGREVPSIHLDELQGIAAWKMSRGVWRERNRVLISTNSPESVERASSQAFAAVPDPRAPIAALSSLAGVGPATASAALAAYAPEVYPFFDEVVAGQIPSLGPVAFTAKFYAAYSDALRERAGQLSRNCSHRTWTPHDVAQALWAWAGGKTAQQGGTAGGGRAATASPRPGTLRAD